MKSDTLTSIQKIKKLLIIVAMDSEEEALLKNQKFQTIKLGKRLALEIKKLSLSNCEIFIAKSGIGLVNAGILTYQVADHIELDAIIQLGVGGAVIESLDPGDIVIAEEIIQHDSVSTLEDKDVLIAPGALTLSSQSKDQVDPIMRTDKKLVQWLESSLCKKKCQKVLKGTLLSGSEFSANFNRKKKLKQLCKNALMIDMEASAIAQVANKFAIPFVCAKTVADRANPSQSIAKDYLNFLHAANTHSRNILDIIIETFS